MNPVSGSKGTVKRIIFVLILVYLFVFSERILPSIKRYPGVVLDVVVSAPKEKGLTTASRTRYSAGASSDVLNSLQVAQTPANTGGGDTFGTMSGASLAAHLRQIQHDIAKNNELASTIMDLVSKNNELASTVMDLVSKNNELASTVVDLVSKNNKRASKISSKNDDLASKIDNLVSKNDELAYTVMGLMSVNDKPTTQNDKPTTQNDKPTQNKELSFENKELATSVIKQETLDVKHDETRDLQTQAHNQLAILQNNVKSLLTRSFALYEYPMPRLFIVLPQDSSLWNPVNLLSNKFRLYFLCECGEHTKSTDSNITHHIHLAKHDGYNIFRPKEFFQQYGPYVFTTLRMLKFGISVPGVDIPAVSQLICADTTGGPKLLASAIEPGMNQVIDYIEKVSAADGANNDALGDADLRQLKSFLKNNNKNGVLGNLYRTVTAKGHVKWICIDHYRETHRKKAAESIRKTVESIHGSFDENIGRVEVELRSETQAEQFYIALESAKSVYELKVDLKWKTTQGNFKRLRDALVKTNVGVLEFNLFQQDGPASDVLNRNRRYDPIMDIMRHLSIQSVTITEIPEGFIARSSILYSRENFSNLRRLDLPLYHLENDISEIKSLVARAPNLSRLTLRTYDGHTRISNNDDDDDDPFPDTPRSQNGYFLQAYNEIGVHQRYPIIFKQWGLYISPPSRVPGRSITASRCMEHLLRGYGDIVGRLVLDGSELDEPTTSTLAKTTKNGPGLRVLELRRTDRLSTSFSNDIARIVSQFDLHRIDISMGEDEERIRILESIQWNHLRVLSICLSRGNMETKVMTALLEGARKMSGRVNLDVFRFMAAWHDNLKSYLLMPQGSLLQYFIASTSIEVLILEVVMTLDKILSLIKLADFSRLKRLRLQASNFSPRQVKAILDALQHATKLQTLTLASASISQEQIEHMKTKGVTLLKTP